MGRRRPRAMGTGEPIRRQIRLTPAGPKHFVRKHRYFVEQDVRRCILAAPAGGWPCPRPGLLGFSLLALEPSRLSIGVTFMPKVVDRKRIIRAAVEGLESRVLLSTY